jgi:hypothetical protein
VAVSGAVLAIAAVGTAVSVEESKTARKDAKKEAQVAQANILARGVATGTSATSGVAQASGSVESQLASNVSFLDAQQELVNKQSIFQQKSADASSRAATASAVSNLALTGVGLYGK